MFKVACFSLGAAGLTFALGLLTIYIEKRKARWVTHWMPIPPPSPEPPPTPEVEKEG